METLHKNAEPLQTEFSNLLHVEASQIIVGSEEVRVTANHENSIGTLTKETRGALNELLSREGLTITVTHPQDKKVIEAKFGEQEVLAEAA